MQQTVFCQLSSHERKQMNSTEPSKTCQRKKQDISFQKTTNGEPHQKKKGRIFHVVRTYGFNCLKQIYEHSNASYLKSFPRCPWSQEILQQTGMFRTDGQNKGPGLFLCSMHHQSQQPCCACSQLKVEEQSTALLNLKAHS